MEEPNVILITVDCLRSDHLGCYGYHRNTSSNIDSLASKGVLFLEAISNGGCTPDAFPSILASQLPPLNLEEYRRVMRRSPTLAGVLKKAGYETAAFHSNPYLAGCFHFDNGFDIFEDNLGTFSNMVKRGLRQYLAGKNRSIGRARRVLGDLLNTLLFSLGKQRWAAAGKLTDISLSWIDGCRGNFLLWSHYMDAHDPYLPPSGYVRRLLNRRISRRRMIRLHSKQMKTYRSIGVGKAEWLSTAEIDDLAALYDANIRYVDDNIGRLMDSLGSRLKNSIIIVTADHGEAFGEHHLLGHHSGTLYEELLRVPLIMTGPGIKAGTVIESPVELMDLAPTVIELLGLDSITGFYGRSLLPLIRGDEITTRGIISTRQVLELNQSLISYRTPEWKYIRTEILNEADTLISEEVYHLTSDPREENNLNGSAVREVKSFKKEALANIAAFKNLKHQQEAAYEKERIRARLRTISL
jgi:arylsulfatase A-like enzyme